MRIRVEIIVPISPEVRSAIRMDSIEEAATLLRRIEQSRRFAFFLSGRIFAAYYASLSSSLV